MQRQDARPDHGDHRLRQLHVARSLPGSGANSPANVPEQVGNLATGLAKWAGFYVNDNITLIPQLKLVGGVRQDIY